ncbi:MCE family protein [Skermania sp. ID1734]|uniref:MCE family protein n=1 Tax=Skermania sp. ID1734 TaxID=2597516 RepID=UPI00117EDB54|nr:MCE family protein [Skermania sp. ID1734]TSD95091.1 MCE family protein [Skermania sp. ID1734]
MKTRGATYRNRALGLAFLVLVGAFVWVTIAMYNKQFTKVVKVNLLTDTVGNSLPKNADVKIRGIEVGQVRDIAPQGPAGSGEAVKAVLAMNPDKIDKIPSNVTARLLPKTLFGERYVDLVYPDNPSGEHLAAGMTIKQDKSGNAIELGQLFDSVLPLLQAIPPKDLASTLGALSQALSNRGESLGVTLDRLNTIATQVNGEMPDLQQDLRQLVTFSNTYSDAFPELIDALNNLRTTNATIVDKRPQIVDLFSSLTSTGAVTADFLNANRDNIIGLSADSKEALSTLATYSPELPCVFANFAKIKPRIDKIMGAGSPEPGLRVSIELTNTRGRYLPNQDEPRFFDNRGPWCEPELPLGVDVGQYPGGKSVNDGSYQPPTRYAGPAPTYYPTPQFSLFPGGPKMAAQPASIAGSPYEKHTMAAIYSAASGVAPQDIPSWTTLIGAPAFRGSEVSVR